MSEPSLTEAERATVCICPWTSTAICEGDTHETRCSQHRAAVEAILAARLASTSRRDACITCTRAADTAEAERDEARANHDRLAHENAALRQQVAGLTAERDRYERRWSEDVVPAHARAEAAERALAARDLCSCGHEPHLHDVEAVPSLCLICGHEDDCGLTASDAVAWRAKERALRDFHREAIAEATEEVAARDEVIARVQALINVALSVWSNTCGTHCSEEDRTHAPECLLAASLYHALAALDGPAPQPEEEHVLVGEIGRQRCTCYWAPRLGESVTRAFDRHLLDVRPTPPTTDAEEAL